MKELKTISGNEVKYLTVDRKTLAANQASYSNSKGGRGGKYEPKPPCWIQVGDDKQNKINAWEVFVHGVSCMRYGPPEVCGAMVYVETHAELSYYD